MQSYNLMSPNGRVALRFTLEQGSAYYRIEYEGKPMLLDSKLELVFADNAVFSEELEMADAYTGSSDSVWTPVYGERSAVRDFYNELVVTVQEKEVRRRRMELRFRAYNEGIGLRYAVLPQGQPDPFVILREYTEFRFPAGCMGYEELGTEGEYFRKPIGELADRCERPLTVEYPHGAYLCITEANLYDYSQMRFRRHRGKCDTLYTDLCGPVQGEAPFATPWRVFIVGSRPGDLLEHNDLVLNLNEPCALEDTSWIKPGKVLREISLSTEGGKQCVDFAAAHNLDYIEYDAGWYGHEYDIDANANCVSLDPDRVGKIPGHPGLELEAVIRYAETRGIGVILYVNHRALERQLDQILPLYRSWGVKGLKFGFVEVGPQAWTKWLLDAVKKCAEYKLVVDIHDNYRPTGFSRTYPNLLTQEGIRGNEHFPTSRHNVTLPFTRFPGGAGDYTICYYSDRLTNTRAHQLGMSIVAYSPLQFLFWYDPPSAYRQEPEIELFRHLPTVWDETKVLDGVIGEYVIIARRKGSDWFLGALTNETGKVVAVPLRFLKPGTEYEAFICTDDDSATAVSNRVKVERKRVHAGSALWLSLAENGGAAIRFQGLDRE